MLINNKITDDNELTKLRQEYYKSHGIKQGFPVYVVTILPNDIHVFFTHKGKEEFIRELNEDEYKQELIQVTDVKTVSFES